MADAFNSTRETIGSLLGSIARERIAIPTFQRGYMWKKKHVEAFWQDVAKQKEASKSKGADPHFLGPIVTLSQAEEGIIWLLDGQQRLATATILFSVIRDVAREINKKTGIQAAADFAAQVQFQFIEKEDAGNGYSLEMGQTDAAYFRETVQLDPPTNRQPKIRTHRNVKAARQVLIEKVKALTGQIDSQMDSLRAIATLKELKQTIVSDLVMARIPVTSQQAAFRIFETLNDRGLRLSPPDLLLSYLMEKAPDSDRKDIRDLWTEIIVRMGTHDINRFMRHMWVSSYGDLKKDDLFTALKKHIEEKQITSVDFARLCGDECENYVQLMKVEDEHLGKEAAPFVRALVQELDFQASVPILLSSYLLLKRADFVRVAQWLLVFVTRYSIISDQNPAGMEDLLFSLAREVRGMIKSTEPGTDYDVASKRCATHIKEKLVNSAPADEAIKQRVSELILEPSEAKYVVSRLARYLQSPTKEITLNETNLEHIFPQNPKENEWGGTSNQEVLEPYLWHIGNLTIFGKRLNREAANKEYATVKKLHYEQKSEVIMTQEIAREYSDWNEAAIKDRATKLAKRVVEVWNFDNPSRV